jgi:hypothetical protein
MYLVWCAVCLLDDIGGRANMNMSLYELFVWLTELDFPSIAAIWAWLITVPWWLAIFTVVFTVFAIRITWYLITSFFSWFSNWMYEAGGVLRKWILVAKRYKSITIDTAKSLKRIMLG